MYISKIIRSSLIPSAALLTAEEKSSKQKKLLVCRPSELPIYCPDIPTPECIEENPTWIGEQIQKKVATFRTVVEKITFEINAYEHVAKEYVKQGIDSADDILTYLRQENNTAPKVGAIAIGGLTGLIFSLRKGFFKRMLYTTGGATIMTAICYPKQTSEYVQIGSVEAKKYANIAYNFAYGVKKGDPPVELPSLPELPSSVSEVWDSIYKTTTSLFLDKADSDFGKCNIYREDDDGDVVDGDEEGKKLGGNEEL